MRSILAVCAVLLFAFGAALVYMRVLTTSAPVPAEVFEPASAVQPQSADVPQSGTPQIEPTSTQDAGSTPTPQPAQPVSQYEMGGLSPHKSVMTTLFWVGEGADASNAYISNAESFWDERWAQHFGGVDDPHCRNGYNPCGFAPKENPFYFALPYGEYDDGGDLKASAKRIPWYEAGSHTALLKNRWIEVQYRGKTCYGQWEDVGPFESDDFAYVFGSSKPRSTYNDGAGLDISPALWDCLGLSDNTVTSWRFVDAASVPEGPWSQTVTTSGISWQ